MSVSLSRMDDDQLPRDLIQCRQETLNQLFCIPKIRRYYVLSGDHCFRRQQSWWIISKTFRETRKRELNAEEGCIVFEGRYFGGAVAMFAKLKKKINNVLFLINLKQCLIKLQPRTVID